jgi:hypothetical protein
MSPGVDRTPPAPALHPSPTRELRALKECLLSLRTRQDRFLDLPSYIGHQPLSGSYFIVYQSATNGGAMRPRHQQANRVVAIQVAEVHM